MRIYLPLLNLYYQIKTTWRDVLLVESDTDGRFEDLQIKST